MNPNKDSDEVIQAPDNVALIHPAGRRCGEVPLKPGTPDQRSSTIKDRRKSNIDVQEELRLSNLILDVKCMAVFAAEKGILPEKISLGEIYNIWHAKREGYIESSMINTIAEYYLKLEDALGEVTAFSLRATRCHDIDDCMDSDAGRYVQKQINLVFAVIFVIVSTYIYGYYYEQYYLPSIADPGSEAEGGIILLDVLHQLGQYLIPFTFGTLGAMAFILRFSVGRLHKREFDPRRIPGNYIRIVLGTISGGAIVMFINSQTVEASIGVSVTAAALGFLAGYSTDFLFNIVDKLKNSLEDGDKKAPTAQNSKQTIVIETKEPNHQIWRKRKS